jgi:hypothetical protein
MYKRLYWLNILLAFTLVALLSAVAVTAQETDDDDVCPLGQGYWTTHPNDWAVDSLQLGAETYTQEELLALLSMPTTGDASLILAHQLIAVKLNIANGADPTVVEAIIAEADEALATFEGKLPYGVAPSSTEGSALVIASSTFDVFNSGVFSDDCDDDPEVTPEITPEVTPEITPEVTPEVGDDLPIIIVIEGPVKEININIIVIYNINIVVDADDPILLAIRIGDIIRVEGELEDDDTLINVDFGDDDDDDGITIIIVAINITVINVEIFINDGDFYRDDSSCGNPPPPWAPAHGWRRRCEAPGGSGGRGGGRSGSRS